MACMEVSEANADFEVATMPAGKFAKFTGHGNMFEIVGKLWGEVWKTELKRTYQYDFEKYHYSEDQNIKQVDIYIGIE